MYAEMLDAEKLIEISDTRELVLQVGHLYRFNNSIKKAKQLVNEDELGKYIVKLEIQASEDADDYQGIKSRDAKLYAYRINNTIIYIYLMCNI